MQTQHRQLLAQLPQGAQRKDTASPMPLQPFGPWLCVRKPLPWGALKHNQGSALHPSPPQVPHTVLDQQEHQMAPAGQEHWTASELRPPNTRAPEKCGKETSIQSCTMLSQMFHNLDYLRLCAPLRKQHLLCNHSRNHKGSQWTWIVKTHLYK